MHMKGKLVLVFSIVLLASSIVQNSKAQDIFICRGYIGDCMSIGEIRFSPREVRIGENLSVSWWIDIYRTIFIEMLEIKLSDPYLNVLYHAQYVNLSQTVSPQAMVTTLSDNAAIRLNARTRLDCLVNASYTYVEDNQTIRQKGANEFFDVARAVDLTNSDLAHERYDLLQEVANLTATIGNLESSRSDLQNVAYFLAFTTCGLLIATVYFAKVRKTRQIGEEWDSSSH